jgi:hypothetical protein
LDIAAAKAAPPTSRGTWFALGLTGIALRICLWMISIGSNDAPIWLGHGLNVATNGIAQAYPESSIFNHPPLMGLFAAQAWWWSNDNLVTFARLIKIPGLLGEAITLWALWRFAGPRSFAAYALLPVAILISAYHGNTDCLYAAFLLVSAIAFDRQRFFLSGLLFSAALNVKVLPLVLLPLPMLALPDWRAFRRFSTGLTLGLIPFVPPALVVGRDMYHNMLVYNSNPDNWGLLVFLNHAVLIPGLSSFFRHVRDWYLALGRYVVLMAVVAVALISRFRHKLSMAEQLALGAALFLVLTPGFGVQYVILAAPLLCLVDLPAGIEWGCTSGLFLAIQYWLMRVSGRLLTSSFHDNFPMTSWVAGLVAWFVLLRFIWYRFPRWKEVHARLD